MMAETTSQLSHPKTLQILVVEDEVVIAKDIEECLENLGYSVTDVASSGTEAINKATQFRPDLVLMDIRLEGDLDGIQAAAHIWGSLRIPVVYLTGFSDKNTLERAKITHPFGYILKPVEEQELYVAIETAVHQHQANREIQDREQWLMRVLRDIGDGVIVIDTQKNVMFLNLVATTLTGWKPEEAIGKNLLDVFPIVDEQTHEPIENPAIQALETGQLNYLPEEVLLVSKDGLTVPISDSAAPLRDESGAITGAVLIFRDITQRRLAEEWESALKIAEQLKVQMQELERLNQLKDDFLSTVSHELRTPLANMKMSIQMLEVVLNQQGLLTESNPDRNRTVRYLEILRNQCNQELALVNDLLNLQHLNASTYTFTRTLIELESWILDILEGFQERIQSNQQRLQANVSSDMEPIVFDEPSLVRILSELLNNACKYTPVGETITVSATILKPGNEAERDETQAAISSSRGSHFFQINVCNSGVELPMEEQDRIFEPFYRIPRSDLRNQGGTGLGLALVKKLVNHLGGSIQAESGSGQTCFIVELPIELPSS